MLSALAESLETFVSESEPAEPFYRLARHAMDGLFARAPVDLVAAYFDRLVRSLRVQFELIDRVERAGGEVLTCDAGRVTNGPKALAARAADDSGLANLPLAISLPGAAA